MSSARFGWSSWCLAWVLALLLLAGCGDDDGADSSADTTSQGGAPRGVVTEILRDDGRFETLLSLFETATVVQGPPGAREVLGNAADVAARPGWDHTVFAPTDDAFSELDQETTDCMSDDDNATSAVRVHVVPSILTSDAFENGDVTTIAGVRPMTVDGDSVSFSGAEVVEVDIRGTNGVIHVIDAAIVPPVCE